MKIFLAFALSVFMLQACYKDRGNYEYISIDDVKPQGGEFQNYAPKAYIGERYRYYPLLEYSNPSDTSYFEFWWEYSGKIQGGDTICKGRELDFIPSMTSYFDMLFCVLNTRTGIILTHRLQLEGVSSLSKGWAILCEKDGKSVVSFIRPEYKEEIGPDGKKVKKRFYTKFYDIYGFLHDGGLGSGPIRLRQILNEGSALLVLQKESPVYLNGISYVKEMELTKEFAVKIPDSFVAKDFYYGVNVDVVMSENGYIYTKSASEQMEYKPFYRYSFASIPVEYQGNKVMTTQLIDPIATLAHCFPIYEEGKSRFIWMYANRFAASLIVPGLMPEPKEGEMFIDLNNMAGWKMLYCAPFAEYKAGMTGTAYYVTLFKKDDQVMLQQFKASSDFPGLESVIISEISCQKFAGEEHITDNTKYYMLKTRPYLFWADKNVIYWCDLTSGITKDFYTKFPAGTNIVAMNSNPQESELGVILDNGMFVTLNVENSKLYDGIKIWDTEGLGKCVDLIYKFTDYDEYANRIYNKD